MLWPGPVASETGLDETGSSPIRSTGAAAPEANFADCCTPRRRQCSKLPDMREVHHETVHFSGRVQGVGFRYTALQIAREYEVAGYVQNLPDGRVRIEAEGGVVEIGAFVAAIEERMEGYIRQVERAQESRAPQFDGFTVR